MGRIQSHFEITGCDSIKLTNPVSYSLLQRMCFIPFVHTMTNKGQIATEDNLTSKLVHQPVQNVILINGQRNLQHLLTEQINEVGVWFVFFVCVPLKPSHQWHNPCWKQDNMVRR